MAITDAQQDVLVSIVVRGMARGEASADHQALADAGLLLIKGPMMMPTPAGTEHVGAMLCLPADAPQRERLMATFHRFLPINRQLRDLCTAWQMRPDGSVNDHSDSAYDADIRDRLDDINDSVAPLLKLFAEDVPSLDGYADRLNASLENLDEGDNAWLASPLIDSYHTVWMHLHQELLLTIGMSRAEDEALEEQLVAGNHG